MGLFGTSVDDVGRAISRWKPGEHRTEASYRNDLREYLERKFKDARVAPESGKGRTRADLRVDLGKRLLRGRVECFVELKNGLATTSKLQRLIGQLSKYANEDSLPCFVVICGEANKTLVRELEDEIKDLNKRFGEELGDDSPFLLIVK